jgi:hypothetical protein
MPREHGYRIGMAAGVVLAVLRALVESIYFQQAL